MTKTIIASAITAFTTSLVVCTIYYVTVLRAIPHQVAIEIKGRMMARCADLDTRHPIIAEWCREHQSQ